VKQILFVCTGNTCRSSMAKAIFDNFTQKESIADLKAESAGTAALDGMRASDRAIEVMKEMGIDLSSHRSKKINEQIVDESSLILTMTRMHKMQVLNEYPRSQGKVYTLKEFADAKEGLSKDIGDPFGQSVEVYRNCANEIKAALEKALNNFG